MVFGHCTQLDLQNGLRILWFSSVSPCPALSGNHLRNFYLLRATALRHRVTLVCPAPPDPDSERQLQEVCDELVTLPSRLAKGGFTKRSLRRLSGIMTRFPHCFVPDNLGEFGRKAGELRRRGHFDVAFGNLAVAPVVLEAPARLHILDAQNVESELYRRIWLCERLGLRKLTRLLDWWAVAGFERKWLSRADGVTACSERDRVALADFAGTRPKSV